VLIADDESVIRDSLRMILEYEGFAVTEAASGNEVLAKVADRPPSVVLLDVKMPDLDGLGVLAALRERSIQVPVVVFSGHGDIATAVEATRLGAFDFLEKPLQRERVLVTLRNAIEGHRLAEEVRVLRQDGLDELVGRSAAMTALRRTIEKAAPTPATVLITGESGTGKELVARAIHAGSQRSQRPLVQVNCAAIPDELIESELFGHEKGSFTGAVRRQIGKFVAADGGTIFLDEIGDMSPRTQAKVLRVLQNGEVEPVGASRTVTVDVRVVAATHRDLSEEIARGNFREDLYYRLNVIPVHTPPLRDRTEDLRELIEYFVARFGERSRYAPRRFTDAAYDYLESLPWKGNVRELKNMVERLLILGPSDVIDREDLLGAGGAPGEELSSSLLALETLRDFREASERLYILHQLEQHGWNVTQTARGIDTPRSNLYKKMEHYGIQRRDADAESDRDEA
jgi:two-component system nitrogen regulation response regulator NtrX